LGASERAESRAQFECLYRLGIRALVRLTDFDSPESSAAISHYNFKDLVSPIGIMGVPPKKQITEIMAFMDKCLKENLPICVSCRYGHGRTGTVLALYLVHSGYTAEEAIALVRKQRKGSLQTKSQEEAVKRYEHNSEKK